MSAAAGADPLLQRVRAEAPAVPKQPPALRRRITPPDPGGTRVMDGTDLQTEPARSSVNGSHRQHLSESRTLVAETRSPQDSGRLGFVEIPECDYLFGQGILRLCNVIVGPRVAYRGEWWVKVTGTEVNTGGVPLTAQGGALRDARTAWVRPDRLRP